MTKPPKTKPPSTTRDLGHWLMSGRQDSLRPRSVSNIAINGSAWLSISIGLFLAGCIVWGNWDGEIFSEATAKAWFNAMRWGGPGVIILLVSRHYDRLDPFSPSFRGQKSLDELGEHLDRELDKHHRPLR